MFQLIISIVSIALTSTLAVASLHYGGAILTGGTVKANVATLLNDGQQISNAVVLDSLDNPFQPVSIDRIPSIPIPPRVAAAGATWQVDPAGLAYIRLSQDAAPKVCTQVQQLGGLEGSVGWSGAAAAVNALRTAGRMFGCVGSGADAPYFAYRLN